MYGSVRISIRVSFVEPDPHNEHTVIRVTAMGFPVQVGRQYPVVEVFEVRSVIFFLDVSYYVPSAYK